jgi:broad specificity phosphatase PhoE
MTMFYLVRHGQTDWNKEGRYQGQADTPLNAVGEEQARLLAGKFDGIRIDAIYSSDLQRARRTAEAIGQALQLPVQLDVRLREINHGVWEGMLFSDIVRRYAPEIKERAPGGESVTEVADRVLTAAESIARMHPDETVILVSHGLSLAILACAGHGYSLTEVFKHVPENARPDLIEWIPDSKRVIG